MTFAPSHDYALIQSILADQKCYRRMVNDKAPDREDFRARAKEGLRHILAYEQGKPVGVYLLVNLGKSNTDAEVHFSILPEAWGRAVPITESFLGWVWQNTTLQRLTAPVPSYNRLALRIAKLVGFREYQVAEDAGTRRGSSFGLILMELVKG